MPGVRMQRREETDRVRTAGDAQYDVSDFARKYGLTTNQVSVIIGRSGQSRERADQEARHWKQR